MFGISAAPESLSIWKPIRRRPVKRLIVVALFCVGACVLASAQVQTPEIDPGSGANALALIGGALMIIGARKRK